MRPSVLLTAAFAVSSTAAPALLNLNVKNTVNPFNAIDSLSGYFNLIASKVQAAKVLSVAPVCDLSKAQMPNGGLQPPSPGLTVHHIAVGRGTQNYSCATGNADAVPKAEGAVATLFNVSCVAATYPDVVERIPSMAVHFNLTDGDHLGPTVLPESGKHYFKETSPFFDLTLSGTDYGVAPCAKNGTANAPSTAGVGQLGEQAVTWLRLTTTEGATENIQQVFRVNTAGGSAPATCKGMPAKFEVQYSAVYWFWQGKASG